MYRGTTPTIEFTLPFEASKIDVLSIAFAQKKTPHAKDTELVFEKALSDCVIDGATINLTLSEEDTLKLDCHQDVEIQLRVKCGKTKMASKIYTETVERILKDGCLA